MISNVTIVGDGAMGTVCASILCSKDITVKMWGHDRDQLLEIRDNRENKRFLPGYSVPENLVFEPDDKMALKDAQLVVSAVPCQFTRSVWQRLKAHLPADVPVLSVTKGIEIGSSLLPTQILSEVLGSNRRYAVLSGPNIADEVIRKLPATACVATTDQQLACDIQKTFNCGWFRVYTNRDIVGVELAGAMKNVIAIAAGIIDGIKAGDNAKAALLARGLSEISRLGIAMGANRQTFAGLSGLGDLVTTCISPKGRNRSFGDRIGMGMPVDEAISATQSVVEGVPTCKSVQQLADKYAVELPITQSVYEILFEHKEVGNAIADLMSRELKSEVDL